MVTSGIFSLERGIEKGEEGKGRRRKSGRRSRRRRRKGRKGKGRRRSLNISKVQRYQAASSYRAGQKGYFVIRKISG